MVQKSNAKKGTWGRRFVLALAAWATCGLMAAEYNGVVYETEGDIVPGEWNGQYWKGKAQSEETDTPLVVFWANPGCAFCRKAEEAMATDEFKAWMQERQYLFVFALGASTKELSEAKSFSRSASRQYPYVAVYRQSGLDNNAKSNPIKFSGRSGSMPVSQGTIAEQLMASIDKYIGSYEVPFKGGKFEIDETDVNRLEAESTTTSVPVTLTRSEAKASKEANSQVLVILPGGTTTNATIDVNWTAESGTSQTIDVAIPDGAFTKAGDQITLVVVDEDGKEQDTTHITYVEEENSAYNPLWMGERTATVAASEGASLQSASQPLAFGEWTMDLDAAKSLVSGATGNAYTLALVEGSLWCPDCEGVFKNFLSVKDGTDNKFAAWAKANQVALVAIDVPQFTTNTVESTKPTLLSRELRSGSLDPQERSGLGYLSRKGATDDAAAEVLERNRKLVSTNTSEGGFHRPENANPYRTGVPMFVLLRKDGTVAARLTRFSDMGREVTAANWANYIKRFDEMLALASDGEHADDIENNDASSTKTEMVANGGTAAGELSHADAADFFKLTGVAGAAVQRIKISSTAKTSASVTLQCYSLDADGKSVAVGTAKTVSLPAGGALETEFTEPNQYYVKVSVDATSGTFDVASATATNFVAYSLASEVAAFMSTEVRAPGKAAEGSSEVVVMLEKGQLYRFEGVETEANASILEFVENDGEGAFYAAKVSGTNAVKVTTGDFVYQKWVPGTVAFGETANKVAVSENAGSWTIPVVRTGGVSGDVTVKVAVNKGETTYLTHEGADRYEFADQTLTWKEGDATATNVVVKLLDDTRFDGNGKIVFDLTVESGASTLGAAKYTLTITENEKVDAGTIGFTDVVPFFAKPYTVYVKASDGATIIAERSDRNDGAVSATIKPSVATASVAVNGTVTNVIAWADHNSESVEVKVDGLQAGKTVKVTMSAPKNGVTLLNGATSVSIVPVADDAPEFAEASKTLSFVRYVAVREEMSLKEGTYTPTNKITITKLNGTLPTGLAAAWDATSGKFVLSGVPTAKAGSYRATFQVSETRERKAVPGLTLELEMTVVDSVVATADSEALNPSVAVARAFKAIPIVSAKEMTGTLDLTIPATGKISAKYISAAGTIAFSAKNWSEAGADGTLVADAANKGYTLKVSADPKGAVRVEMTDPNFADEELSAELAGTVWSKTRLATEWAGYYTVAMKPKAGSFVESKDGVAPRGSGYLMLTMTTANAKTGAVKYSGMLPNGTAVSGSSTLTTLANDQMVLALFKKASKDVFAALPEIRSAEAAEAAGQPTARVVSSGLCETAATLYHTESVEAGNYSVYYDTYGNIYSGSNLAGCCEEGYETDSPELTFDLTGLNERVVGGTPKAFDALTVKVTSTSMALAGKDVNPTNPQSVTFTFAPKTGLVKGTFYLPYTTAAGATKTIAAKYQGVVVTGWGEGCGCADADAVPAYLPFVNGAYYFADKLDYEVETRTGTATKQLTVQRGGEVLVK